MSKFACLLWCVCVMAACKSKTPRPVAPVPDEVAQAPSTQAAAPSKPAAPKMSAKQKAAVADAAQSLLAGWLAAQNDGDFDAYGAFYASKFYGIKRAGKRTYHFDHDGWLSDRKRMFRRKMTVKAEDVSVTVLPTSAMVQFVQHWASGRFADEGPKRLLLVQTDEGLRISNEEMLQSRIATAARNRFGALKLGLVKRLGDEWLMFVGGESDADPVPAQVGGESSFADIIMVGEVANSSVDTAMAPWLGMTVSFGNCNAKVTGFRAARFVTPHFGQMEEFAEGGDMTEVLWTGASKHLALVVKPDGADCASEGIAWAPDPNGVAPQRWRAAKLDKALRDKAVSAFRKLPQYQTQLESYVEDPAFKDATTWDENGVRTQLFESGDGKRIVFVSAAAGEGCSGFWGEQGAVFGVLELKGDALALLSTDVPAAEVVQAVIDIDGQLHFVIRPSTFVGGDELMLVDIQGETVLRIDHEYWDCPC